MEQPRVLDRDRRLQREARQELELGVVERAAAGPPDGHRALDGLAGQERRHHQPLVRLAVGTWDLDRARVGAGVVDEFGAARREQAADDADAGLDLGCLDRLRNVADRDDRAERSAAGVGQEDRAVVRVQQVLRVAGDPVHDRARSSVAEMSRPTSASAAVSRLRRCVSSNRRAFSSAMLMLLASVCSRRTSDSPNACSRCA